MEQFYLASKAPLRQGRKRKEIERLLNFFSFSLFSSCCSCCWIRETAKTFPSCIYFLSPLLVAIEGNGKVDEISRHLRLS